MTTPSSFSFQIKNQFPEVICIPLKLLTGSGNGYTYTDPTNPENIYIPIDGTLNLVINSDGSMKIRGHHFSVTTSNEQSAPVPFKSGSIVPVTTTVGLGNLGIADWHVSLSPGSSIALDTANIQCPDWTTVILPKVAKDLYPSVNAANITGMAPYSQVSLSATVGADGVTITGTCSYPETPLTTQNATVNLPVFAERLDSFRDFVTENTFLNDDVGHGTATASIIVNEVPEVKFWIGKCTGNGHDISHLLAGLDWLAQSPVKVICMPIGLP